MNRRGRGVDVCNCGLRRILLPRAAAVAAAAIIDDDAAAAATAVAGHGLLGERRECREVATLQ